jgi:hypothetical protein
VTVLTPPFSIPPRYSALLSVDGPVDALLAPVRAGLSIFGPMLTNLDRAPLTLGAFVRRNIVHSTVSLVKEIGVWYSTSVVVELYKLVGSADWLGNPVGLVSSISKVRCSFLLFALFFSVFHLFFSLLIILLFALSRRG